MKKIDKNKADCHKIIAFNNNHLVLVNPIMLALYLKHFLHNIRSYLRIRPI